MQSMEWRSARSMAGIAADVELVRAAGLVGAFVVVFIVVSASSIAASAAATSRMPAWCLGISELAPGVRT